MSYIEDQARKASQIIACYMDYRNYGDIRRG